MSRRKNPRKVKYPFRVAYTDFTSISPGFFKDMSTGVIKGIDGELRNVRIGYDGTTMLVVGEYATSGDVDRDDIDDLAGTVFSETVHELHPDVYEDAEVGDVEAFELSSAQWFPGPPPESLTNALAENPAKQRFAVGDIVRHTGKFLKSIGVRTAPIDGIVIGHTGTFTVVVWSDNTFAAVAIHPANIELDRRGMQQRSAAERKAIAKEFEPLLRRFLEQNPNDTAVSRGGGSLGGLKARLMR